MMREWSRPEGVTLRLVLVRHGEPEERARGRCYGRLDVALSERGRRQMRALREIVSAVSPSESFVSPAVRARESAELMGLHPRVDERLHELDFGELEGLTYEEAETRFRDVYAAWMARPTAVRFPGGESFQDLRARVERAMAEIRERHRYQSVAVVSHGGVHRAILGSALAVPPERVFAIEQSYGGVSVVDDYDETPVVRLVNGVVAC